MLAKLVTTAVVAAQLGACSVIQQLPPRGQTQWDPKGSQTLLDQIPNWDGEAESVCAGHIPQAQRRAYQTDRC